MSDGLGSGTVDELLLRLRAPAPEPAGGSAAALCGAMAAALVELVARATPDWHEAPGVAAQASALRYRLVALADADAAAFAEALAMLRAGSTDESRDHLLGEALALAADAPLAIAEATADIAELAARAAADGRAEVRPDALVARELATAATRAAAHLVDVNLASRPDDERTRRARAAVASTEGA